MSAKKALTPAQVAEAARLYQAGRSCNHIAQLYYVHPTTIARHLRLAGVKLRPSMYPIKTLAAEEILKTTELAAKGLSQREIGQILGIHQTTVNARLRKHARPKE